MKPHKHAELIKAWADGAEIEVFFSNTEGWSHLKDPTWDERCEYRVKPTPCPHAELMLEYAKDAQTNERPWELWERNDGDGLGWRCLYDHPAWIKTTQYRRKEGAPK